MKIAYGKRRWVPDCCPRCGESRFVPVRTHEGEFRRLSLGQVFGAVFKVVYSSWRLELGDYPSAPGLRCWWGVCGRCTFEDELMKPSFLLSMIPKDEWQGGTLRIPLRG